MLVQHLVSSLSLGDCSVHRLRVDCHNLCTEQSPKDSDGTTFLFNTFPTTVHIEGRFSIRNLRTRHAVVTATHLSRVKCVKVVKNLSRTIFITPAP